jgi:hypothetical protein
MTDQVQAPVLNKPVVANAAVKPAEPIVQANAEVKEPPKEVPKEAAQKYRVTPGTLLPADLIPANWVIETTSEENVIYARNGVTNKEFVGPKKDLGRYLRGE